LLNSRGDRISLKMNKIIVSLIFLWIVFSHNRRVEGYTYDKGNVSTLTRCPGRYCGRELLTDGNTTLWSGCGACPRGFRVNLTWACTHCDDALTKYDWMYLCFMALAGLLLQWYSIDKSAGSNITAKVMISHSSALLETVLSAIITLLISDPVGSLDLKSCAVRQLSDWYTQLHNPQPNYEETLYCAHEAVYPLYSLVFIHYGLSVVLLLTIRPCVNHFTKIKGQNASKPIYFALYFFPVLSVIHGIMAGLIYYAYPYVILLLSLMSHAFHFSSRSDQAWRALLVDTVSSARNLFIVLGHWLLHAYGLAALTMGLPIQLRAAVLTLVPLPTFLYILLARFTDPVKFHSE